MRVAVIGAGRMGAIRVEDLVTDPRVDAVAVTNRTEARAAEVAAAYGAEHVPWGDARLDDADAFVITTGTDTHLEHLERLLPLGRPVLCEKPIALTLADTRRAIALAEHHATPFQIGFQRRFDPGLRDIHDRIADGSVGTLYSLVLTAHDHTPSGREFIAGSGGIFRDMHVHDFDQVRWLTGEEIAWVHATSAVREHQQYAEFDDADTAMIMGVTEGGVSFSISGTRHDPVGHDVRLEAFGTLDTVVGGLTRRTPLHALPEADAMSAVDDPYRGFVDRFRSAFMHETRAFVSYSLGETANPCPPDSALESLRAAIACEESIRTGIPARIATISDADH